ncbi:MAG: hypothetical protein NWF00_05890 [Candidatus Bathyarchaeota archaeon]|nr:hypothetical protein [Candidatus Bathyarchaeota archaeon]
MSCTLSTTISTYYGYQCETGSPFDGSRGVTYWGYPSGPNYTIPPNGYTTITFTCTEPRCYQRQDWCNFLFLSYANNTTPDQDINLEYTVNGVQLDGCYLSRLAGHGAWQGYDVSQHPGYRDVGLNTFVIHNTNNTSTVTIFDFQIFRAYEMCDLSCQSPVDLCDGSTACNPIRCRIGTDHGSDGNLDTLRVDYPCRYETTGRRSVSGFSVPTAANTTIEPGGCMEWVFNWSPTYTSGNYQQGQICLFNFNQMVPLGPSENEDVSLTAYINGTQFITYYLSKTQGNGLAPSYNLLNTGTIYNDTAPNTVKIVNNSDVPVLLDDEGGINIYRVYVTDPVYVYILATAGAGGTITPSGTVTVSYNQNQTFNISPSVGYQIDHVDVDGVPQGAINTYTFYNVTTHHRIDAYFTGCGGCETTCQAGCEVSCESCYSCQDCQVGCEVSCESCYDCQTGCEVFCQAPCESCQMSCQWTCMTACQLSCQTCNTCQTTCELSCQTGCEVTCETACEVSCMSPCMMCQMPCLWSCLMAQ